MDIRKLWAIIILVILKKYSGASQPSGCDSWLSMRLIYQSNSSNLCLCLSFFANNTRLLVAFTWVGFLEGTGMVATDVMC